MAAEARIQTRPQVETDKFLTAHPSLCQGALYSSYTPLKEQTS